MSREVDWYDVPAMRSPVSSPVPASNPPSPVLTGPTRSVSTQTDTPPAQSIPTDTARMLEVENALAAAALSKIRKLEGWLRGMRSPSI